MNIINNYMAMKGITMNLFKMCSVIKAVSLLVLLLLSGCNLLPESAGKAAINKADQYEIQKEVGEYQQQIKEMLSMRDDLNRLIELEADLTFLLDEMGRFEEQNPNLVFTQANFDEAETAQNKEVIYSSEGVASRAQTGINNPLKFSEPSNLESLGLASNRAEEQTVLGRSRFSEQNATFSSPESSEVTTTAAKKMNSALAQPQLEHVNNDKFSTGAGLSLQSPMRIVAQVASCGSIITNKINPFAVHLASYGSEKSAFEAWKRIMSEYGNDLCTDIAKTQTVLVKGKTYHRLNAGGYVNKDIAERICSKLKNRSAYCKVVKFEGEMI